MLEVNELREWLAAGRVRRSLEVGSRITDGDRLSQHKLIGDLEQTFCFGRRSPRIAGTREVADRRAQTLGRRREQNAFSEAPLVVRIQIGNFRVDDNSDPCTRACEMTSVGAVDRRQSTQHLAIADHDEFPGLTIAGAAGPSGNFENITQNLFGQWVRSKLPHSA